MKLMLYVCRKKTSKALICTTIAFGLMQDVSFLALSQYGFAASNVPVAQSPDKSQVAGQIVSVLGRVFVRKDIGTDTEPSGMHQPKPGDLVMEGDVINTSSTGGIKILLKDRTILDLGGSSLFKISEYKQGKTVDDRKVELSVAYGSIRAAVTEKLKGQSKFRVRTPSAVMGVRGTIAFSEVSMGSSIANMSGFLNGKAAAPAAPATGTAAPSTQSATTFLITQGQGVVTPTTTSPSINFTKAVVLNPGDQSASSVNTSGNLNKTSLTPIQFNQKNQQVQNMSRTTDTAFVMATNFDKAMEQRRSTSSTSNNSTTSSNSSSNSGSSNASSSGSSNSTSGSSSSTAKSDAKSDNASSGGSSGSSSTSTTTSSSSTSASSSGTSGSDANRGPASITSSGGGAGIGAGPLVSVPGVGGMGMGNGMGGGMGGGILDSITTSVVQVAPPPPQVTVSNMGISGAPTNNQILTQQSGTSTVPAIAKQSKLTVNVSW